MNREEWQTLILNLDAAVKNLRKDNEALAVRVASLERGKRARMPLEAQKTVQNKLADVWIETYKGKPMAVLFKIGSQLVRDYGLDRVVPVLRHVFTNTRIEYLSLHKIAGAFEVIEAEMKNGGRPRGDLREERGTIDAAASGSRIARELNEREAARQSSNVQRGDGAAGGRALPRLGQAGPSGDRSA